MVKSALYGRYADTGLVECTAEAGWDRVGGILTGKIVLRSEVWTAVPFGERQERCHQFEVLLDGPGDYEAAYAATLGEFERYWREQGADVDPGWKDKLAVACGRVFGMFMREHYLAA